MIKQIICVKWGQNHGPEYVNRLYAMAARHVTPPFCLVCLTNHRCAIRSQVECFELPELGHVASAPFSMGAPACCGRQRDTR
jgi:hypothetical protein